MTKRHERKERTNAVLAEPEFIDRVCEMIVDRCTLDAVAKEFNISYHVLHRWIHEDSARVKQYAAALEARVHGLSETVIGAMLRSATADIRKLYDDGGVIVSPHKLPNELADVVSSVKHVVTEEGKETTEYRLMDRGQSQASLARVLGLFKDKLEMNVTGSLAQRMDAAAVRRRKASEK